LWQTTVPQSAVDLLVIKARLSAAVVERLVPGRHQLVFQSIEVSRGGAQIGSRTNGAIGLLTQQEIGR
jgi:hypothetical protein